MSGTICFVEHHKCVHVFPQPFLSFCFRFSPRIRNPCPKASGDGVQRLDGTQLTLAGHSSENRGKRSGIWTFEVRTSPTTVSEIGEHDWRCQNRVPKHEDCRLHLHLEDFLDSWWKSWEFQKKKNHSQKRPTKTTSWCENIHVFYDEGSNASLIELWEEHGGPQMQKLWECWESTHIHWELGDENISRNTECAYNWLQIIVLDRIHSGTWSSQEVKGKSTSLLWLSIVSWERGRRKMVQSIERVQDVLRSGRVLWNRSRSNLILHVNVQRQCMGKERYWRNFYREVGNSEIEQSGERIQNVLCTGRLSWNRCRSN